MGRLWQSGFELNSTTNGVEWGATLGSPTITSTVAKVRAGTYAGQISGLVSATQKYFQYTLAAANANGPYFVSFYIFFDTLPSAANTVFAFTASNGSNILLIKCDNTGAFTLWQAGSQIGSASSTIATGGQHKVDVWFDNSGGAGAGVMKARLDGVQFAASTTLSIGTGIQTINFGGNVNSEAQTTGTWYFDDIKLNDSSGTNETSYPGDGKIIHLRSNAAGDNNAFSITNGGTAGSTNNYTRVNEVTPDDGTTYNASRTAANIDDFNIDDTPADLDSSATVHCIAVGVRYACTSVTTPPIYNLRYKSAAAGTVTAGSNIQPNSLSYNTEANSDPKNYTLVAYQTPGAAAITKANLDTSQIGYTITTVAGTSNLRVTAVWMSVDYTPSSGTLYTSSLSATYSTSGVLTKTTNRLHTSSYSASGALTKFTSRLLTAIYKGTGVITGRSIVRLLVAATYSASGALTWVHQHYLTLTGTYSASGALLLRSVARIFNATYSASATLNRFISRLLTASYSSSGSLTKRQSRTISGTYSASGVILSRSIARLFAATYQSSGAITLRAITRLFSATYQGSGALGSRSISRTFIGTYQGAGTLSRSVARLLSATYSSAGSLASSLIRGTHLMSLSGTYSASGLITSRAVSKTFTATYSASGTLTRFIARLLPGATYSAAGSLALLLIHGAHFASLAGTYFASGSLNKSTSRQLSGAYSSSGSITSRALARTLSAIYSASGALSSIHRHFISFTSLYSASGLLTRQPGKLLTAVYSATGTLKKKTARSLQASYIATGLLAKKTVRSLIGGVYSASGNLAKTTGKFFTATYVASGFWSFIHVAFVVSRPVISLIINTLNPNRTVNDTTPTKDISGQTTGRDIT